VYLFPLFIDSQLLTLHELSASLDKTGFKLKLLLPLSLSVYGCGIKFDDFLIQGNQVVL
jgi:hypothetical protein